MVVETRFKDRCCIKENLEQFRYRKLKNQGLEFITKIKQLITRFYGINLKTLNVQDILTLSPLFMLP